VDALGSCAKMEKVVPDTHITDVGIISMFRVPNYGSYLQSLGLMSMLHNLGFSSKLLDYKPEEPVVPHSSLYYRLWRIKKNPVIDYLVDSCNRGLKGDSFPLRYKREFLPEIGVGYASNHREPVDIAIVGSDEVFNCLQSGFNVGFSPMLFGEGVHADKVASYAASFGSSTIDKLYSYGVADRVASWLRNMSAISVRDLNSKGIVDDLLGADVAQIHLDPVLVSDFVLPDVSLDMGQYAVLYTYKNRVYAEEEIEAIRRFCVRNGLRLVSFGDAKEWVDEKIDAAPLEMLAYFSKASFVITDTFHGAVFSIKTNRNFAVLVRDDNRNKLEDLLLRVGQGDRIMSGFDDLQALYDEPAVFDATNRLVDDERKRTRDYLRRVVQSGVPAR